MRSSSGFTLPELVITLVVIGIMAAVVVPRFVSQSEFDVFGVTEQTRSALRFAQKSAVAKRRNVCVTIDGNSLALTFGSSFDASCIGLTCTANPDNCLKNPGSGQPYVLPATAGISLTSANFSFDALGKPGGEQTLSVSGGTNAQTITVEAETGYVH
ncbi:hypothetical protein GCM10027046_34820 [Uliginosibacterium flavum]|uniref:Type II secretion system protein n=1 Tax=Uliginosibacterium flavum TaxID=1396831 RepID=A0ABV2TMF5_9RHOO